MSDIPQDELPPERMTAQQRHDELVRILCSGLRRILSKESTGLVDSGPETIVDFSPLKSGIRRRKLRNRVEG